MSSGARYAQSAPLGMNFTVAAGAQRRRVTASLVDTVTMSGKWLTRFRSKRSKLQEVERRPTIRDFRDRSPTARQRR